MAFKGMAQINKKDLWTIPNIITYFRILCIPAFVTLMALAGVRNNPALLYWGAGVFVIATLSDLVDGYIARKFNMITTFGKLLDPLADKLTQFVLIVCLALKRPILWYLVSLFVIKEGFQLVAGTINFKRGRVLSAVNYNILTYNSDFRHGSKPFSVYGNCLCRTCL